VKVSGRFVVLSATNRQSVEALVSKMGSSNAAPMRGGISGAAVAKEPRGIPLAMQVSGSSAQAHIESDRAWVLSITPTP